MKRITADIIGELLSFKYVCDVLFSYLCQAHTISRASFIVRCLFIPLLVSLNVAHIGMLGQTKRVFCCHDRMLQ